VPRLVRAALFVLFVAAAAGLVWQLAYRAPARPASVRIATLTDSTTIRWAGGNAPTISAEQAVDQWAAIGYAHGQNRAWPAVLWRQTALGHLARWFGEGLVPLDAHVRRLGLAHGARAAYEQLPPAERSRLQAYARGMNAALASRRVQRQAELALLDKSPPPWKPWHSLAVERLFAWLGTSALSAPDEASPAAQAFVHADARLRQWLHLHGFDRSIAWTVPALPSDDPERRVLLHRFVTGASALPTVQELIVAPPNAPPTTVATLPGSPITLSGAGSGHAWALLPTSKATLERRRVDASSISQRHERIETRSGREQLVRVQRAGPSLLLTDSIPASTDSVWSLTWRGLGATTDASVWMAQMEPTNDRSSLSTNTFRLFSGTGLSVDRSGAWRVIGTPAVVETVAGGVLVGRSHWAREQARSLRARLRETTQPDPAHGSVSDSSTWAAQILSAALPSLAPLRDTSTPMLLRDALTYLRNWNATFDRSSIGAAVFAAWMRQYRTLTGSRPMGDDPTFFAPYYHRRAFVQAVESLSERHGPDLRQWRWENVAPHRRSFPVWSADSLVAQDLSDMAATHYGPLSRLGSGHASALSGGPSLADPTWPAPSPGAWTGWTDPARRTLTVRRLRFDPSAFLARPLLPGTRPPAVRLSPGASTSATLLLPR
jgi:hypothetical protein